MISHSTRIRAAVLALAFAIAPSPAALAQHRGHHKGGAGGGANPAAKPAQAARPATKPMQHAQATNPQANKTNLAHANQQFRANQPRPSDASLVSSLHSTRMQLAQATHDYNGHRARAMREVEEAMRLLGHRSGQANAGTVGARPATATGSNRAAGSTALSRPVAAAGTGTTTGNGASSTTCQPTTQAASDSQLRSAQQTLTSLESQMDTNGINPHNFVRAKDAVQSALREVNLALIDR